MESCLVKENILLPFFSENLSDLDHHKYLMYEKEFYIIIYALHHLSHYLLAKEFILFSDHKALKYLTNQQIFRGKHATLVEFLSTFHFILK